MAARSIPLHWEESLLERLQQRAQGTGISASALAQRYVDEAMRMDEHPGIVFRDGPAGRRATLVAGPNVWEVVQVLRDHEDGGEDAVTETAIAMDLTASQVQTASRYCDAFPDEVRVFIKENERAADEAIPGRSISDR